MGGYLIRKNNPEPGAKVIWRGFEYLRTFMDSWELMQPMTNTEDEFSVKKSYGQKYAQTCAFLIFTGITLTSGGSFMTSATVSGSF